MSGFNIDIKGLDKVIAKMSKFPTRLKKEMNRTMKASLDVVQEKTPGYPPQRANQKTNYIRTGTLARSLGKGVSGGNAGKPSIYSIKGGGKGVSGAVGTNLNYAKYVVDEKRQAHFHKGWWWTMQMVGRQSKDKIVKIWNDMITFILNK